MAHGATDTARRRTAVGYLRRSTDRQEQSIPDQRKAVEQYAKEQELKLHMHYLDDAISGTSAITRKAFQQMMADAQQGVGDVRGRRRCRRRVRECESRDRVCH